jgi:hypothetical protein
MTDQRPIRGIVRGIMSVSYIQSQSEKAFDAELGHFMDTFSLVEGLLLFLVISYAKLPTAVGKALLSPLRVDSGVTVLKRVIEARRLKTKRAKEIVAVLDQLVVINKARNDIFHLGLSPVGSDGYRQEATNRDYAHSRRIVRSRPITRRTIRKMIYDLDDIYAFFLWHMSKEGPGKIEINFPYAYFLRKLYPLGTLPTWRYRYPEPKKPRRTNRGRHPVHAPQHRSLPA